ncbi:MAG: hypothetical protein QOI38_805 [Sphingomonadales bacterium]|nr:hypothetical protein [Sphingomonadales bacterium]
MGSRKERPLLQAADLKFRRRLAWIGAGIVAVLPLLIAPGILGWVSSSGPQFEIYKLVLQFILITVGGGVFLALVGHFRDVAVQKQGRAAAIQELNRELDTAYRALKKVKRRLCAHRQEAPDPAEAGTAGADAAASGIPRAVFEKAMDDLLEAQIRLETICDHIGQRNDILRGHRLERMQGPLRYASRYYHDVYEDFEKGRAVLEGDRYLLAHAFNLTDYLRSSRDPPAPRPGAVDDRLGTLKDERLSCQARSAALEELVAASPRDASAGDGGSGKLRYADVAGACFGLLSAELAEVRASLLS